MCIRDSGVEVAAQRPDAVGGAAEVDRVRQQDQPRPAGGVEREAGAGEAGMRDRPRRPRAARDVEAVALAGPAESAAAAEPGGLAALRLAAQRLGHHAVCLLYTSDAADDLLCVDL